MTETFSIWAMSFPTESEFSLFCKQRGEPTVEGEVVDEDDLLDQPGRRPLEDADDCPEQGRPGLVVECHDDRGRLQFPRGIGQVLTAVNSPFKRVSQRTDAFSRLSWIFLSAGRASLASWLNLLAAYLSSPSFRAPFFM